MIVLDLAQLGEDGSRIWLTLTKENGSRAQEVRLPARIRIEEDVQVSVKISAVIDDGSDDQGAENHEDDEDGNDDS